MEKLRTLNIFIEKEAQAAGFLKSALKKKKLLEIIDAFLYDKPLPPVINIVLTGDKHLRRLNKQYRGLDKTTDVLSFNYAATSLGQTLDEATGEIYLSLPYLKKRAKEEHADFPELLQKATVHGILHLAGYDHEKDADYVKMQAMEKKINNS